MTIAYRLGVIATITFRSLPSRCRPPTLRPRLSWSTNASNANTGDSWSSSNRSSSGCSNR